MNNDFNKNDLSSENNQDVNLEQQEQNISTENISREDNLQEDIKKPKKNKFLLSIIIIIFVSIIGFFIMKFYSSANSDYICTRVVEQEGVCGNGSWSDWEITNKESLANNNLKVTSKKIYTGQKAIKKTVRYENLRTNCGAGFSQSYYRNIGGASGFRGGTVSTEYASCQIIQTKNNIVKIDPKIGGQDLPEEEKAKIISATDTPAEIIVEEKINTSSTTIKTETLQIKQIVTDFQCSTDQTNWHDCENTISTINRNNFVLFVKAVMDPINNISGYSWTINNNPASSTASLNTNESRVKIENEGNEQTKLIFEFGNGQRFNKNLTLKIVGYNNIGHRSAGEITKDLNIYLMKIIDFNED
jgi:hypothetical protein